METTRSSFVEKLVTYLSYLEIAALLVATAGLAFAYLHLTGNSELLLFGFTGLAMVYFLSAFTVPPAADAGAETPEGAIDLFAKTIGRKVIYLGCAVSIIGLLFGILHLNGSEQLLLIGGTALVISSLLVGFAIMRNNAVLPFLKAPLIRAVPVAILSLYWIYAH